jgi:hypothetical protein
LKGSNKMVIGCWAGRYLIDIDIVPISDGKKVIERITEMAQRHGVQNKDIAFDADGVGGFVDGFLIGAIPFNGGLPPKEVIDKTSGKYIKENYFNLKTQCFYRSGMNVEKGLYKISPEVAIKMYDNKMTVRQRFMYERKAIKRDKVDMDGKLKIIPKDQMKIKLNGDSPDMMDMFMINEIFDLIPTRQRYTA